MYIHKLMFMPRQRKRLLLNKLNIKLFITYARKGEKISAIDKRQSDKMC